MEKIFGFENRTWERGDLVQIDCTGTFGDSGLGVVIAAVHESDRQGNLFPAFYVYNMSMGISKKYYSYDLELISSINS